MADGLPKRVLLAQMPCESLSGVERMESAPDGPEGAATEALQSWMQELRCHVVQKSFHDDCATLKVIVGYYMQLVKGHTLSQTSLVTSKRPHIIFYKMS